MFVQLYKRVLTDQSAIIIGPYHAGAVGEGVDKSLGEAKPVVKPSST